MAKKIIKEIKNNTKILPLSILISDIKNTGDIEVLKSKITYVEFYRLNNYPIHSHFKKIIRF